MSMQELVHEDAETVEEVTPDTDVLEAGQRLDGMLESGVESTEMVNYAEPLAKGVHGHAPRKNGHHLCGAFNVNPELIKNNFAPGVIPNGHEALHYMTGHRKELIEAPEPVFSDGEPDDSASRWGKIERAVKDAPIPPHRAAKYE